MKTMNGNRALSEMSFMENLIAVIVEKVQLIDKKVLGWILAATKDYPSSPILIGPHQLLGDSIDP